MEDIEKELEEKTIERDVVEIKEVEPEPEPVAVQEPPKKVKKPRSQKQIEAFERAKQKRAENILLKKKQKEEEKIQKKVKKEPGNVALGDPTLREPDSETNEPKPQPALVRQPAVSDPIRQPPQPSHAREQVVNNYYYYGVPPPQYQPQHYTQPIEKKYKKRPPTPESTSSEESSEEEEVYQPQPTPKPQLKFRFA